MRMMRNNKSTVVGIKNVRMPWKMQNGMINCLAISRIFLTHGGKENLLNFFISTSPILCSYFIHVFCFCEIDKCGIFLYDRKNKSYDWEEYMITHKERETDS